MKKFFLTMLIGLLPMIGWAEDNQPEITLVETSGWYDGDATIQPLLARDCARAGAKIVEVWYLGFDGSQEPVQTFDIYDYDPVYDPIPVRNVGFYKIVATYNYYDPTLRAPQDGDPALDGETTGGDDDDKVELMYEVESVEFQANPADLLRVYGDETTRIPMRYSLDTKQFRAGDNPNHFEVRGGYVGITDITTNVGSTMYQSGQVNGYVYMYDKVNEDECHNYWVSVTGNAAIITVAAELRASVGDLKKTYGQCDEEVINDDNVVITYTGFVNGDEEDVVVGKPIVTREDKGNENVGEYQLGLETEMDDMLEVVKGVSATNYVILPAEEQGKLTIEQKSITEEMIASVKYFVDGEEANYTVKEDGTVEVEGFTYGKVLTWEITMIDNDVCISKTGKRELTPNDVDTPVCVDGDCGDDLEICGKGNYKECIPFRVPDPDPACLTITAAAEPDAIEVGEEFEIQYEITGWQKDEDFSEAVKEVISYKIYDAAGEEVTQPIDDAIGEFTVKFTVGELPAEPAGLANYTICDEPEDITVTVDPICFEKAIVFEWDEEGEDGNALDEDGEKIIGEYAYTGSQVKPTAFKVYYVGGEAQKELVKDVDYTVEYGENVHANVQERCDGTIKIKGAGIYDPECSETECFEIVPSEAIVYVADINFDVYEIVKDEKGEDVKQYQNGKYYGQFETKRNITLGYEGITAEALEALDLDIYGKRFGGNNVGFYSVAIWNGNEVLTPTDAESGEPVEATLTFGDITIKFVPGLYEIRKNTDALEFHAEMNEVYGEIGIDIQKLRTDRDGYLAELIEKYFDEFEGKNFHGDDDQSKLRNSDNTINTNIVDPWGITFDDIAINGVSITVDGVPNMELFKDVICNPTGYIHAGTYHVDIVGATSPNYNIGTIDMDVTITERPIEITIDNVELAPREELDLSTVTWTGEANKPAPDKRGYAQLDAPTPAILNVVIVETEAGLDIDYDAFNPDYAPEVKKGEVSETIGHFILHRVNRNVVFKADGSETDPAISSWNDAVQKITYWNAEDGEAWNNVTDATVNVNKDEKTIETVYFRTFGAKKVSGDAADLIDLIGDGELEPNTVVDGEGGFPMYAGKWYTMVLPFDVSIFELCHDVFTYAVVNVLDKNNTDPTKMQFKKQEIGTIKANTPFLISVGDMDDYETYVENKVTLTDEETGEEIVVPATPVVNLDELTFSNKKIVKPENFDEIYVEDATGLRFWASYTGKWGYKENEYFFTTVPAIDTFDYYFYGSDQNTEWMRPTMAYGWVPQGETPGARRLFVELEDGTYTEIKSLNNESLTKTTSTGWFTLDGKMLNNRPTQKGVYINNGKKVVVK